MTSNSARLMLRRGLAAAGQSTTGALPSAMRVRTKLSSPSIEVANRFFGSPANAAADAVSSPVVPEAVAHKYENLVEESIKKLMTTNNNHRGSKNNRHEVEQMKPISNEDLEGRLRYFEKVFEEAELCLKDLRDTLFEADDEQYLEECSCAEGALNNAFTAYIDLLEDFRRSNADQLHAYSVERGNNAGNLKRLRKELDQIIEVANNRESASR